MQTSRETIIDAIELIINQIALCSHCQELINTYLVDFKKAETDEERELIIGKITQQKQILEGAVAIRRELSNQINEEFQGDQKLRCSFKHALAAYGYAVELWYANFENPFYEIMTQKCYEQMISVVSLFLGLDEMVICGRCLQDALKIKKEKNADGQETT